MSETLRKQHENYNIQLIEDTFMSLFEKKGLNLTVREICEAAGISRPVFYRLYDDKFEVLDHIEDRLIEDLQQINASMPTAAYQSGTDHFPCVEDSAAYVLKNRNYFAPLICSPGDVNFINRWCRLMRGDVLQRLTWENHHLKNAEVYAYSISMAAIGVYEYWLRYMPQMSPQEVSMIITKLWDALY